MPTTYTGSAALSHEHLTTEGIARIYQTSASRWEGEFLRGDPDVLWKMFSHNASLTLEAGQTGTVMVQSYGEESVSLIGSGPWPFA